VSESLTGTGGDVLRALRDRRSVARMKPEMPPRELIECVLEAATWAPNHYRTAPWRFVVITGTARSDLGEVMARSLASGLDANAGPTLSAVEREAQLQKERKKPLRAPVVIAVACVPSHIPKVESMEEMCAVAAGVQNMLIAAEAVGLGAMWRTGAPARDPLVKAALGLPEEAMMVAFIYIGYPDVASQHVRERDPNPFTTWLGDWAGTD
jgi:nitroreductase